MKKNYTRLLIIILVVVMLSTSISAFAINPPTVEPYYEKISHCAVFLNISSRGYAECQGNLKLRSGATANMTVTLYKSADKSKWTEVDSWSTSGASLLSITDGCYVMSGYYYAAMLDVDVYDSNGSLIESTSLQSNISYY